MVAIGMGALLILARAAEGPLDDPDAAHQRPGFLDAGELPVPAPRVTEAIPAPGRAATVFFVRPPQLEPLCEALPGSELVERADVVIVVAGEGQPCQAAAPVLGDPAARLAQRFGLSKPRDGGPPVGYAVVDTAGQVRYRTLDPMVTDLFGEVATIVAAT